MQRGRQIARQWKILRALERARRGMTVGELHDAIDERCAPRTLYRDLEQIERAGFPLTSDEGRWRLLEMGEGGWSMPARPTEVLALSVMDELLGPIEGSHIAVALGELRGRLRAMLSPEGRAWCDALRSSAVASLFAPGDYRAQRAELDAIHQAASTQRLLRIVYAAPRREPAERHVEPYCTWYAGGRVYLIAHCRKAGDIRTFALQRIVEAEVLDEHFEPDPSFDAAAFSRQGFGVYHGKVHHFVIDFAAPIAHLIRERRYHQSQRVQERLDGVRLHMRCRGLPEVAAWVAGFGGQAVAREPPELCAAVEQLHRKGLRAMAEEEGAGPLTSDVNGGE